MSSILNDIKKVLGVHQNVDDFDVDLIMHINSAFFQLMQLGIGPEDGFVVTDDKDQWEMFLQHRTDLQVVKSYVAVVVRLIFDRPETSYGIAALEKMRDEWAWRLTIQRREVP